MKSSYKLVELKTKSEMLAQFSLVKQLTASLKKADYSLMLNDMLAHGYRMIVVYDGKNCAGLSGFWISTKIYSGKYVELDNVIIDKNYRSKGIGKILCDGILEIAKNQGCKTAMLDAYVENSAGHKFYLREGYIIRGFHFIKTL
ncbi:MAG: GNAT family N-acetyltransferase [Bacteroidia bacterium]|nr:GNAT family N-acetyltransferase [Bacteroidia bacterium]